LLALSGIGCFISQKADPTLAGSPDKLVQYLPFADAAFVLSLEAGIARWQPEPTDLLAFRLQPIVGIGAS
jgi:hypothetical protein